MKLKALSFFSKKLDVSDTSPRSSSAPLQSGTRSNAPVTGSGRPSSNPGQDRFASSFTPSHPTRNPHLADPSQTQTLRPQITQQAQGNPSFYGTLVSMVNSGLQQAG